MSEGQRHEPVREGSYFSHHVVSVRVYLTVFAALLILTGLTVVVATVELGEWDFLHTPLALTIALIKTTLVVLWFMHVRYSEKLTWVFIAAGILWLGFLIVITMADYLSRHRDAPPSSWTVQAVAGPADPGRPGSS